MGCSLLPNALQPFKIYCASPPITSQQVIFLWQTIEIGPLGHMRVIEALKKIQPFLPIGAKLKLLKNMKYANIIITNQQTK